MKRFVLFYLLFVLVHSFFAGQSVAVTQSPFILRFKKAIANPGDQSVHVPIFLSNLTDSIGGWNFLVKYDDSAGGVVNVEVCDSVWVDDSFWYYAPWIINPDLKPPDHFEFTLNAQGHNDWVRVTAIMDMPGGDSVPGLPPGDEHLLFCLSYDVNPLWDGHDVDFDFQTNECGDNTLSDCTGYILWGPDTISAPRSTCPQRPDSLRVVRLTGGVGIGKATGIDDTPRLSSFETFELQQYPNPFSSNMKIEFFLPEEAHVALRIYNLAGELVETLVDSSIWAGPHTAGWDARGAVSGIYFYRIEIVLKNKMTYCTTGKMTLLR